MATTIDGQEIIPTRNLKSVVGQSTDGDTIVTYDWFKTFAILTRHKRGWLTHETFTTPAIQSRENAEETATQWLSANVPTLF
jgi:hypothetical protein